MVNYDNRSVHVGSDNKKSTTMTFRIDGNIITELRNEADNREISLNVLVNQILKRFIEWDLFEPKVGLIPMARAIGIKLFGNMSEDAIADMAQDVGVNTVREISLFMEHKTDLESFFRVV